MLIIDLEYGCCVFVGSRSTLGRCIGGAPPMPTYVPLKTLMVLGSRSI
jgi:hypothetical protein